MNTEEYLRRISLPAIALPDIHSLRILHRAHMLEVPFENLDIHAGKQIVLDRSSLYDKIVSRRRGGFCYELNGLFSELLTALGYNVTMLSARVAKEDGRLAPEFDHMTLLVDLEERWMADVGFGDSFLEPLMLDSTGTQTVAEENFRILSSDETYSLQREENGVWIEKYRFALTPRLLGEFDEMCLYHQTSPESHFTQGRICTKATASGRISLSDSRVIETVAGFRQERAILDRAEFVTLLKKHFGFTAK